ncbi:MAG TPA: beta-N-acetylhexosaminidase, partial [Candidatus Sumerlaeota bacterium]|nr:beta-N-acetylhexosaminidase [Candidatus Sumerlaeota bacterium]
MMRGFLKKMVGALGMAACVALSVGGFCEEGKALPVIPQPSKMTVQAGEFEIQAGTVVVADGAARPTADLLVARLAPATGFQLKIAEAQPASGGAIVLKLDESLQNLGEEGYRLVVTKESVQITARKSAGLFYGTQTLLQLLPPAVFSKSAVQNVKWGAPCVEVEDVPRFVWRGVMLDVVRHFQTKEEVLKFVDLLALHKMNSLHLHLTDDQGWRIEIKKYPKLTEVGAWRKETMVGHASKSQEYDGKRHGGFYTQDDLRQIVAYAQARHVRVVPEIEMPGHAQAAIASYPELGNTGKQLEVLTGWGVNADVFNVEESTILFMQDVLTEVLDIFPSEFIHVGGDEVPKAQWKQSAKMQARIKELGLKNEDELQSYFIKRMDKFLTEKGRRLIGWDEILEGGLAQNATVMSWRGMEGGITAARSGHDVVMAPTSNTYLDFYQGDPRTEPLAIGGSLPLRKVYDFEPVPAALKPEEANRILGTQCQLWAEYIPTAEHLEYMAFPRLTALAEVAWTAPAGKDFKSFQARLKTHLERLSFLGVNYRKLDAEPETVGHWKSGETTEKFAVKKWDLTSLVKKPGKYAIEFQYTGGTHRLDIESAEVLENEKSVAQDKHAGKTGASNDQN